MTGTDRPTASSAQLGRNGAIRMNTGVNRIPTTAPTRTVAIKAFSIASDQRDTKGGMAIIRRRSLLGLARLQRHRRRVRCPFVHLVDRVGRGPDAGAVGGVPAVERVLPLP